MPAAIISYRGVLSARCRAGFLCLALTREEARRLSGLVIRGNVARAAANLINRCRGRRDSSFSSSLEDVVSPSGSPASLEGASHVVRRHLPSRRGCSLRDPRSPRCSAAGASDPSRGGKGRPTLRRSRARRPSLAGRGCRMLEGSSE